MSAPQTAVAATMSIGVPGQIADLHTDEVGATSSLINTESTNSIPFGTLVVRDGATGGKSPTSSGDKPEGIMLFEKVYDFPSERDDFGPLPGLPIQVLKGETGKVLVYCEHSVSADDTVRVRIASDDRTASPPKVLGGFLTSASAGNTVVLAGCRYATDSETQEIGYAAVLEITGPITIASADS
jgi:hypothetical protein